MLLHDEETMREVLAFHARRRRRSSVRSSPPPPSIEHADQPQASNESQEPPSIGARPREALIAPSLLPIGATFPRVWYTTMHAQASIPGVKTELKRWERSIAFLEGDPAPASTETDALNRVLDVVFEQVRPNNLSELHTGVVGIFRYLRDWTAAIIRTDEEHERLYHAVARALFCITEVLVNSGLENLSDDRKRFITHCKALSRNFIISKNHEELASDFEGDDSSEVSDAEARQSFKDFIKTVEH